MISDRTYLLDRFSELRSGIQTIQTTLKLLEMNFWYVFDHCNKHSQAPPFLFPTMTFHQLNEKVDKLQQNLKFVKLDQNVLALLKSYKEILETYRVISSQTISLKKIFRQRTASFDTLRFPEYNIILGSEFGEISKVFCAADGLFLDLMIRAVGEEWITKNKYIPISLFGTTDYAIYPTSFLGYIPYHDSFRTRFWAALAHETGHVAVNVLLAKKDEPFQSLFSDNILTLMNIMNKHPIINPANKKTVQYQLNELTSDIISVLICPSSILTGVIIFLSPVEHLSNDFAISIKYSSHPISDIRIRTMRHILEKTGILQDPLISNYLSSAATFYLKKNQYLNDESRDLLSDFTDFAIEYADSVYSLLQNNIHVFDKNEWVTMKKSLVKSSLDNLSPTELINFAWVKRLAKIASEKNNKKETIHSYFAKRQKESKTFDININLMYKYYEETLDKIKRSDNNHDIRISFN